MELSPSISMQWLRRAIAAIAMCCFTAAGAHAEEPAAEAKSGIPYEIVARDFQSPAAMAFRPGTVDCFIYEAAAGNIVCWRAGEEDGAAERIIVVHELPRIEALTAQDDDAVFPPQAGLKFLNATQLAATVRDDAGTRVVIFELPANALPEEPLTLDDVRAEIAFAPAEKPAAEQPDNEETGEAAEPAETPQVVLDDRLTALALSSEGIVALNPTSAEGWLALSEKTGDKHAPFQRFIPTAKEVARPHPLCVTIGPHGEIVVGQAGALDEPHDSVLAFYHAKTARLQLQLPLMMHDIAALTYSPKGELYALDASLAEEAAAGLYRIDGERRDGEQVAVAKRLAKISQPAAMAFGADKALYVITREGELLRFAPGL